VFRLVANGKNGKAWGDGGVFGIRNRPSLGIRLLRLQWNITADAALLGRNWLNCEISIWHGFPH
jgi:hypothetical protein